MLNASFLEFKVSAQKYLNIVHAREEENIVLVMDSDYWNIIPNYTVSVCPYCYTLYEEKIDTYSLRYWQTDPPTGNYVYWDKPEENRSYCKHLVYTQPFIHLHGIIPQTSPTELYYSMSITTEVPHVIGLLLKEEFETQAVIHSIPICRIENDTFVPRYTLYMITQYAAEPNEQKEILISEDSQGRWTNLIPPRNDQENEEWFELTAWVQRGKLSWIEPENRDVVLLSRDINKFPYAHIQGRRNPYGVTYRDGVVFY